MVQACTQGKVKILSKKQFEEYGLLTQYAFNAKTIDSVLREDVLLAYIMMCAESYFIYIEPYTGLICIRRELCTSSDK